jgi:enoyl-CoA hydratase/carnithine racemase
MEAEPVIANVADGTGTLVLNRPDASNVRSDGMLDGLIKHSALFERDSRVRCVVLSARGKHFMAGANLREFHSNGSSSSSGPMSWPKLSRTASTRN